MAEAVTQTEQSRIGLVVRRARPVAKHAQKFWIAYLALAIILGGAAGAAIVASDNKHNDTATATGRFSDWQPSGIGSTAVRQIAAHVGPEYRLPNGKQMVNIIAHTPALANGLQEYAISAIEVESDTTSTPTEIFGVGTGVMYLLCGSASDCAISPGKATFARGQLIRREALELALLTFKYVDGVQTVLVSLPHPAGSQSSRFMVLRLDDVAPILGQPMRASIGPARKVKPGSLTKKEGNSVDAASVKRVFELSQTQQLSDGSLALVLAPEALPVVRL
jgi:hypothetical protein